MITRKIRNFDLRQIAESGQCFRMNPVEGSEGRAYTVISGPHFLTLSQEGPAEADGCPVSFFCPENEFPFWENYFDLQTDYGAVIARISPEDAYLSRAAAFGSGIRILRQDLWEMIITFIISQQKTIPNIKALVEALCERYGTRLAKPPADEMPKGSSQSANEAPKKSSQSADGAPKEGSQSAGEAAGDVYFTFPTPAQLSRASLDDLLDLKLGYRAKYIKRVCEDACSGALDLERLKEMDYLPAMDNLQQFYGIGKKVANCVCLYGLHHVGAFPIDTWIRRILLNEYGPKSRACSELPQSKRCEALAEENFSRYGGYVGVMQQYIFYYERKRGSD